MPKKNRLVQHYRLRNTQYDTILNHLVQAVTEFFGVPSAFLSILEDGELWFKACAGTYMSPVALDDCFCKRVFDESAPVIIHDTTKDETTASNPFIVGSGGLRFYAGVPFSLQGEMIGTLCLLDTKPREFDDADVRFLEKMSAHMTECVELVLVHIQTDEEHKLLNQSPAGLIHWQVSPSLTATFVSENLPGLLGIPIDTSLVTEDFHLEHFIHAEDVSEFHFALKNHADGVQQCEAHFRIRDKSGRDHWFKQISRAFYNEAGVLIGIQAMLFDNAEQKYLEQRILTTNERMRLLLEASGLGTWDWDIVHDNNRMNNRWCEFLGLHPDSIDTRSMFWQQLLHPADKQDVLNKLNAHLNQQADSFFAEYRMRHEAGHWVWLETYAKVVTFNEKRQPVRLAGTHRDITEKKNSQLQTERNRRLLSFINHAQNSFLAEKDLQGACTLIFDELLSLAESEYGFIGQAQVVDGQQRLHIHAISDVTWNEGSRTAYDSFKRGELHFSNLNNLFGYVITSGEPVIANQPPQHKASHGTPAGHPGLKRFLGLPISHNGKAIGMIGLANKLTDYTQKDVDFLQPLLDTLAYLFKAIEVEQAREAAEQQLAYLASTDPLTNLMNRRAFFAHIENQDGLALPGYGLSIVDIDNFKQLNDTYGHPVGDQALVAVSRVLQENLRPTDVVSRLGGEEFGIYIEHNDKAFIDSLLNKLCKAVEAIHIDTPNGRLDSISASIGATIASRTDGPQDTTHFDVFMKQADDALYQAKANGKNQVFWFDDIPAPALKDSA